MDYHIPKPPFLRMTRAMMDADPEVIERREREYLQESEPFVRQLIRLELGLPVSYILKDDKIVETKVHWTPETAALRDQINSALAYLRKKIFGELLDISEAMAANCESHDCDYYGNGR